MIRGNNMFWKRIKEWFKDINNFGIDQSDDVNVDIARTNYQKYQDEQEKERRNYLKEVCREIKIASRCGKKSITTATLLDTSFMTYKFMLEMKDYFEQRGFVVKEENNRSGILTSWLKISWL
jgi:hypothetical protein